jgi:hypothetical protein
VSPALQSSDWRVPVAGAAEARDELARRASGRGNVTGQRLFVSRLAASSATPALRSLFTPFGELVNCRVMVDADGASRCFAFVTFAHPAQAAAGNSISMVSCSHLSLLLLLLFSTNCIGWSRFRRQQDCGDFCSRQTSIRIEWQKTTTTTTTVASKLEKIAKQSCAKQRRRETTDEF